jgi:exosortase
MTTNVENGVISVNKIKIVTLSFVSALLFAPVISELVQMWSTKDDYSHGFLVIPISLYMVWQKRHRLHKFFVEPSWLGLPILVGGVVIYFIAFSTRFHMLTYLSIPVTILGLLLFVIGRRLTRELLLPVFFLLFMFPIPDSYYILFTNPLKLLITKISMELIYFMEIPVYREGNLIFLATTQLEVTEACSGIRSLYSYLMLGFVFAFVSGNLKSKLILILSTTPLALLINILRVTVTGLLANYYGEEVAQGFFHEFSGVLFFVIGLGFLFGEYYYLRILTASRRQ